MNDSIKRQWSVFAEKLDEKFSRISEERRRLPSAIESPDPVQEAEFTALLKEQAKKLEKHWKDIGKFCLRHLEMIVPLKGIIENDLIRVNHHPHGCPDKEHFDRWVEKEHEDAWRGHLAYIKLWEENKERFRLDGSRVRVTIKAYPDDPNLERNL